MDAITAAYDGDIQMIDSTSVRAHQQAATAKRGSADHCLGRSRGGLTTKIHAVVDAQGLPIRLGLTAGQAHDGQVADKLLDQLSPHTIVLADKAYDADRIRALIKEQGATPNIPAKSNRRWKPCFSKDLYHKRNLIERFFSKLKHFRRVATRYDKLAANFLAMIQLASIGSGSELMRLRPSGVDLTFATLLTADLRSECQIQNSTSVVVQKFAS